MCLLNRDLFTFCINVKETEIGPTVVCYLVYILSVGSQGCEVKRKSYAAVSVQDHFQSLAGFAADRRRGWQMSWSLQRLEARLSSPCLCGDWRGSGGQRQSRGWADSWTCGAPWPQCSAAASPDHEWRGQLLLQMRFRFNLMFPEIGMKYFIKYSS